MMKAESPVLETMASPFCFDTKIEGSAEVPLLQPTVVFPLRMRFNSFSKAHGLPWTHSYLDARTHEQAWPKITTEHRTSRVQGQASREYNGRIRGRSGGRSACY